MGSLVFFVLRWYVIVSFGKKKRKKKIPSFHFFRFFSFIIIIKSFFFRSEYAGRPSKMFWGPQVDKPLLCFLLPIYLKNERKWSMIILKSSRPLKFPRRICYLFQTDRPTRPRPKGRRVVSVKDNWHIRFCPLFRNGILADSMNIGKDIVRDVVKDLYEKRGVPFSPWITIA